jgi:hypothetical protein
VGLFTIAAQLIFNTQGATLANQRFVRLLKATDKEMTMVQQQAKKTGMSVKDFLRAMELKLKPIPVSPWQRNVRIASQTLSSFTRFVHEARIAINQLNGTPVRGGHHAHLQKTHGILKGIVHTTKEAHGGLRAFLQEASAHALAGAMGGHGEGGGGGHGDAGIIAEWIKSAAVTEQSKLTFDAMLGDQSKSKDLMKRITQYSAATPFARADVIGASKRLLNITGTDVNENERLFKMAGNISALRPGSKVEDVGMGIVQATVGEFEILKSSFGLMLNAKMFEDAGTAGSKSYTKAVLSEIERQFKSKTGGRDLVGALGESLLGKVSTLQDSLEIIGDMIGEKLIEIFDMKEVVQGAIDFFDQFGKAFTIFMGHSEDVSLEDMLKLDPNIVNVVKKIVDGLHKIEEWREYFMPAVKPMVMTLIEVGVGWHKAIMGFGVAMGVMAVGGSAIGPIMALVLGGATAVGGIIASLSGIIVPVLIVVLGLFQMGLTATIFAITALTGALVIGYASFKAYQRDSESATQAMWRFAVSIKDGVLKAVEIFMAFWRPFYGVIGPAISAAVDHISTAFKGMVAPFGELLGLFGIMFGQAGQTNLDKWATLGQDVANVLWYGIWFSSSAVVAVFNTIGWLISHILQPHFKHLVSDIYRVGKAFFDFVSGTGTLGNVLKTTLGGVADTLLLPFRVFFSTITDVAGAGLMSLADAVRPYNQWAADQIAGAAAGFETAGDVIREGFLKTDQLFKNGVEVKMPDMEIKASAPVEVKIDGQKIADTTVQTEMRARNSGRGGDPMSPEELGFVLEGNSRIRPVSLNEVAGGS